MHNFGAKLSDPRVASLVGNYLEQARRRRGSLERGIPADRLRLLISGFAARPVEFPAEQRARRRRELGAGGHDETGSRPGHAIAVDRTRRPPRAPVHVGQLRAEDFGDLPAFLQPVSSPICLPTTAHAQPTTRHASG